MDVQAAKLTAQKLNENGIKGEDRSESTTNIKEDSIILEEDEENLEDEDKDSKIIETPKSEMNNYSDLEELVYCRSPNQIKVCKIDYKPSYLMNLYQETLKEYESVASADLLETIRMDFPELKAEAYSSLSTA